MPGRLIINADDFGLTVGINRAIVELYGAGVVSSATLMATGHAFEDAAACALSHPGLGVGCHVVLVDGIPVSSPKTIGTLLAEDGRRFRPTLAGFVRDLLLGRIDAVEMEVEARAQMERLRARGISVTHLDTHKHTHVFPQVGGVLGRIGREAGVPIRNPFEPAFSRRASHPSMVRRAQLSLLAGFQPTFNRLAAEIATTDGTLGVAATGTMDSPTLTSIFKALPRDGIYELCCHPGYNDAELDRVTTRLRTHRDLEREALFRVVPEMLSLPNASQLIHYGDL